MIWHWNHRNVIHKNGYTEIAWPGKERLGLWSQKDLRPTADKGTSCVTPGDLLNLSEAHLPHLQQENEHA